MNFLAPAWAVGLVVAGVARWMLPSRPAALGFLPQAAINLLVGGLALGLGLWWFGRDGKVASYCAMLVFVATSQWLGGRNWR